MPAAAWRERSASGSPAPRACPSPAPTTPWSRPTAGRWRASPGRWPRRRWPAPARPACLSPRSTSAAAHLTASRRRTTAFTEVVDRRAALGWVELVYWEYRPALGWERLVRRADQAQIDAAAGVELLLSDDPALVPLETLPGRNHYEFPAGERPPWQWHVRGLNPGWSS